jgi:hypothetical protein
MMMLPPPPFVPVVLVPEGPLADSVEPAPPAPELVSPPVPAAKTERAESLLAQLAAAPATIVNKPTMQKYLEVTRDSFRAKRTM